MAREDTFGINVKKWCKAHEAWVEDQLRSGRDPRDILLWHMKKLEWLQHERLIHMLVVLLTAGITLFSLGVTLWLPDFALASGPVFFGFLILLAFYLAHYFFLENTVQHWYHIAEDLHNRCQGNG